MNLLTKYSNQKIFIFIAIVCFCALLGAYYTQYHMGMAPCPWCILQRIILSILLLLALTAAWVPHLFTQKAIGFLMLCFSSDGVMSATWQHFVAAKSQSCALTLADKIINWTQLDQWWPNMFEVRASCADAAVDLLGLPYEFWSLALFVCIGALSFATAFRRG